MLLKTIKEESSEEFVKLTGVVLYEDGFEEKWWFELPKEVLGDNKSGNSWLVLMLSVAMRLGEDLKIPFPVDPYLYENVHGVMRVWARWYPELREINIEIGSIFSSNAPKKSIAFFTGGIDSFHSMLRRCQPEIENCNVGNLDALLNVWGFDIPLDKEDELKKVDELLSMTSKNFGLERLVVKTNLRATRFSGVNWGSISHGSALAGVGLFFENSANEIIIGSSHALPFLDAWGSNIVTDPLFSTSGTRIVHDGVSSTRVEKTSWISKSEFALSNVRVCWKNKGATNCSECSKCIRTMATLDLFGSLDKSLTFLKPDSIENKVKHLFLVHEKDFDFFDEIYSLALIANRKEMMAAIRVCQKRSRKLNRVIALVRLISKGPYVWRYRKLVESYLTKGLIT